MCRLSIIVPFLGENQPFEDTLVSVLQNRPSDCEVLVAHRGRYSDPYDLSGEVRFVPVAADARTLAVLNAGLEAARGDVVHLLQPGVLAQQGWTQPALDRFADPQVAAVAPLVLDLADRERIVAAGLRFTTGGRRVVSGIGKQLSQAETALRQDITAPLLAAAFFRQSALAAIGGLSFEAGEAFSDVDIGLALGVLGFHCVLEPRSVLRGLPPVAVPWSFEAGRCAERVFWRYWRESGAFVPLVAHAGHVFGSALSSVHRSETYAQLAGRLAAALEWSGYIKHRKRLRRAAEACAVASPPAADEEDELPDTISLSEYRGRAA